MFDLCHASTTSEEPRVHSVGSSCFLSFYVKF
uniref:Uncharacterized protein n=1 Tax=Arundo donax TaxID=35708 RepID=A0A0A8ZIC6_ARUDO